MSTEVQSVVMKAIKEYAGNSLPTDADADKLVNTIFDKLNTNNDNVLSADDKMSSDWKTLFGIDSSTKLSKSDLKAKIDDIVDEMSADGTVVENDYSEDYVSPEKQKEINAGAKQSGADLYDLIDGDTPDYAYSIVNEALEGVNKDNVLDFLNGYYSKRDGDKYKIFGNHEGIMEALDDEWDGGAISMDNKKNLATSLLALAEENGLGNSKDCKIIKAILKMYSEGGEQETATDFNHNRQINWKGAAAAAGVSTAGVGTAVLSSFLMNKNIGGKIVQGISKVTNWLNIASKRFAWVIPSAITLAAACDTITDNERLDDAMNRLRADLNKKLGK